MSWVWDLYPVGEAHTRLITRIRMRYEWLSPEILFDMLVEFTDTIMMRRCMLGIKERAERRGRFGSRQPDPRLEPTTRASRSTS